MKVILQLNMREILSARALYENDKVDEVEVPCFKTGLTITGEGNFLAGTTSENRKISGCLPGLVTS